MSTTATIHSKAIVLESTVALAHKGLVRWKLIN
jgi:hypothetical protein